MKKIILLFVFALSVFSLKVNAQQQLSDLSICGSPGRFGTFNLNIKYADIVTINQFLTLNVTFHHTLAQAQNGSDRIIDVTNYVSTSSPERIYVRARHRFTMFYEYFSFDLVTNYPPVLGNPAHLYAPSPGNTFDLTTNTMLLTNGFPELNVSFHTTEGDANSGQNAIQSPANYQLTSMTQSEKIWASVVNATTGCRNGTKNFTINMTNGPVSVAPIIIAYLCDDDTDGIITHDLTSSIPLILGSLNPADYAVSFHETEENAIDGVLPVGSLYTVDTPFTDHLYVRVRNSATNEFSTATFFISVKVKPTINPLQDYVLTQRPFTGTRSFNIMNHFQTVNNEQIVIEDGGLVGAHALNVKFFLTMADAIAQTNAMNDNYNLQDYTNVSNPQTIYVSATNVTDGVIGCEPTISSYQLRVVQEEAGVVYIPDANFKAKLIALGYDTNSDGKIQFTEASAVTGDLGVSSSNITDLTGLEAFTNIMGLFCYDNLIRSVDVSHINGDQFDFSNNPNLEYINMKNGVMNLCVVLLAAGVDDRCAMFLNCPRLRFVCIDENENINWTTWGLPETQFSTYCTFSPGGNFNKITGKAIYDLNNNSCDATDAPRPFLKLNINDGTNQGSNFTNSTGDYLFYTQAGNFTVTPQIENPSYFNFNPANAVVNFPVVNNAVSNNNFCISANGIRRDLEAVIAPIVPARPGFDAVYRIVYKNKGNQTVVGHVNFTYNDNLLDLISSSVATDSNLPSPGFMVWTIPNIKPFENGYIDVVFNVNSPTETPAVNIGDILTLRVFVDVQTDETWVDNEFILNQTVVGSFDPNDIQCLQGESVAPSEIGKYLHYLIRFENTGTDHAENIVIKNVIDASKYDVSSLQLLNSSHEVEARVKGNIAEFIFQNVDLDSGGHGNILIKLKSLPSLTTGSTVTNSAAIFFDYNYPVNTNDANTLFEVLSIGEKNLDKSVKIYPNPASEYVNVKASSNINSVEIYDVQGRILVKSLHHETEAVLDITKHATGIYYLKIKTDEGFKVEKLVKK